MQYFTLATALMAGLSAAAASPKTFKLQTFTPDNRPAFNNLYIQTFHTGAAMNAAVAVKNEADGNNFYLNSTSGSLTSVLGTGKNAAPYSIGLASGPPYNSTAPKTLNDVTVNVGYGTKGFALSGDEIIRNGGHPPFYTFTLCHVAGIAPYESVGPQTQLLWRPNGKIPTGKCADVVLKTV